MEENTLSVLKIAPGQHPQQVEIDNDLKALQQAVGGSIGASYPFADPVAIVYNDDGKLMGLLLNRALWDENGQMYDAVAGTFLVVGLGEEDFASLSPEMAQKYAVCFRLRSLYAVLPGVAAVFDFTGGRVWLLCVDFHGRFDCRCSRAF